MRPMSCFLRYSRKVKEPEEMIGYDQRTRREKAERREGNRWPAGCEVLQVDHMTDYGEERPMQRQIVIEI